MFIEIYLIIGVLFTIWFRVVTKEKLELPLWILFPLLYPTVIITFIFIYLMKIKL